MTTTEQKPTLCQEQIVAIVSKSLQPCIARVFESETEEDQVLAKLEDYVQHLRSQMDRPGLKASLDGLQVARQAQRACQCQRLATAIAQVCRSHNVPVEVAKNKTTTTKRRRTSSVSQRVDLNTLLEHFAKLCKEHPDGLTAAEIATHLSLSRSQAKRLLRLAIESGRIERSGQGRNVRYRLTASAQNSGVGVSGVSSGVSGVSGGGVGGVA